MPWPTIRRKFRAVHAAAVTAKESKMLSDNFIASGIDPMHSPCEGSPAPG
jgi:hypothetical protein